MSRKKRRLVWWLVFGLAMFLNLIVAPVVIHSDANAHDWYPSECCSGTDCDEVQKVDFPMPSPGGLGPPSAYASTPRMDVTTPRGTVEVPRDFRRRESKDNKFHACIAVSNGIALYGDAAYLGKLPVGTKYLRCIFFPPAM